MERRNPRVWVRRLRIGNPPYKVDLGCKENTKPGFIGLDHNDWGQDIVWDITEGLPFPDNSVEEVFMGDFLEHIAEHNLPDLWRELRRCCRNGAIIETRTPLAGKDVAYYSTHVSYWNARRFRGIAAPRANKFGWCAAKRSRHTSLQS